MKEKLMEIKMTYKNLKLATYPESRLKLFDKIKNLGSYLERTEAFLS